MGGVFGKSKKNASRVTEHDKAVLVIFRIRNLIFYQKKIIDFVFFFWLQQMKQQRDKIKQYQKRIEQSLEKDRELAKQCLNKGQRE
jgi:charged multivesicular body protein 6